MQICPSQGLCNTKKTLPTIWSGSEMWSSHCFANCHRKWGGSTYVNWPSSSRVQVDSSEKPMDGVKYSKQWGFCHYFKNWFQRIKNKIPRWRDGFPNIQFEMLLSLNSSFSSYLCVPLWDIKIWYHSFSYKEWRDMSPSTDKQGNNTFS